jgi:hypothetical protein
MQIRYESLNTCIGLRLSRQVVEAVKHNAIFLKRFGFVGPMMPHATESHFLYRSHLGGTPTARRCSILDAPGPIFLLGLRVLGDKTRLWRVLACFVSTHILLRGKILDPNPGRDASHRKFDILAQRFFLRVEACQDLAEVGFGTRDRQPTDKNRSGGFRNRLYPGWSLLFGGSH